MLYINFSASINEQTSRALMNLLATRVTQGENEFYLLFSSPGGNVTDGIALHNFIRALPAKIIMHNIGHVDSIGNMIFLAAEERYSNPHSSFLFHKVSIGVPLQSQWDEKTLKEKSISLRADQQIIANIISEKTKLGVEEAMAMFYEEKTMMAEDAKITGIVRDVKQASIPEGAEIISLQF